MRTADYHRDRERNRYWAKKIWTAHNGPIPKDDRGRPFQIHHKDRNWRNNSPENLQCVSRDEHEAIHLDERIATAKKHMTGRGIGNQHGKANAGRPKSAECKAKLSAWRTGRPMAEETKRKIALANIGKNKGRKKAAEEIARTMATKAAKRLLRGSSETNSLI